MNMVSIANTDVRRRLLILTAGAHQVPILKRARALGFSTVVADADSHAAARSLADVGVTVDVTDKWAVLEIARANKVSGVVAEQTDIAVPTAAFVCTELGLTGLAMATAKRATNKKAMRDACAAEAIAMPSYRSVQSVHDAVSAVATIGLPVVFKPADSQGSRGITKVTSVKNSGEAYERAFCASPSGAVLVEQMLVGTEGSIESMVANGKITVLGVCDKRKSAPPFSFDLELTYPGDYTAATYANIIALNTAVITAVGISSGLTHLEFIISGDTVALIEIAARGCGARVATDLLPALTGIDVLGLRLRQAAGESVIVPEPERGRCGVLRFLELPIGRIAKIGGLQRTREHQDVLLVHLACSTGDMIEPAIDCQGRPGFVMTTGRTRSAAAASAELAMRHLDIHVAPLGASHQL